jgi:PAS domain S-box-containing protein
MSADERAEETLSTPEKQLRLAAEAAGLGFWSIDLASGVAEASASARLLHGVAPDAPLDRERVRAVHPEDRARVLGLIEDAIARQGDYTAEFRVATPDGSTRWLASRGRVVPAGADGSAAQLIGVVLDITERKQREEERATLLAQERDARLRAEQAAALANRLHTVAAALAEAATPREVAAVILNHGLVALGAREGSVVLLVEDGAMLETIGSVGYPPALVERWRRFPLSAPAPIAETVRTGEIIVLSSREAYRARYDRLPSSLDIQLWVTFPLLAGGRIIGGLGLSASEPRVVSEADRQLMLTFARQCGEALERARLYETEHVAREQAVLQAERLTLLHDLTAALSTTLTVDQVTEVVVTHGLAALRAERGLVSLLSDDGATLTTVSVAPSAPEIAAAWRTYPSDIVSPMGEAVRRRSLVVVESREDYLARYNPDTLMDPRNPMGAWIAIPLLSGTRVLGVLGLRFSSGRTFGDDERAIMGTVGELCAQAIERARLYEAEQANRQRAEEAAALATRLHAVAAALAQAATPREVAAVILDQGLAALRARIGSVVLLAEEGTWLETIGSLGYPPVFVERWRRFPLSAPVPIAETVRTGEIIVLTSREEALARYGDLTGIPDDICFWVTFPLLAGGRIIGGVRLSTTEPRAVGEVDRQLMLTLARQCGEALERARLYEAEQASRQRAEEAAALANRLHSVAAVLAQASTPREVAAVILDQGIVALGARHGGIVLLTEDGAMLETLGEVGYPPELAGQWQRFPLNAPAPLAETVRTGEIIVLTSREAAHTRYATLAGISDDFCPWVTFPLLAGGRIIGGVGLSMAEPRAVSEADQQLLLTFARQCGEALERARLYEAEHIAREQVTRQLAQLTLLHRLTAVLAMAVTTDQVTEAIIGAVSPALRANGMVVSLVSDDGTYFINTRIAGYTPVVAADWRGYSAAFSSPIADAVKTREVVVLESPEAYAERYPPGITVEAGGGTGACVAIPLLLGARVLGGIGLSFAAPRSFGTEDAALLRSIGELCAQALERARLYDAERLAVADLRARTVELETLLRVLPIGIGIASDPSASDIRVNPAFAQMLGIPPDTNASLSAPETERPTTFRVYQGERELAADELPLQVAAAQDIEVRDVEVDLLRDDGVRLTLVESAAPLHDDAGQVRGAVGAFLDITTRALAERQRDMLMASMAHDLKNPLTTLVGMGQLLQRRAGRLGGAEGIRVAEGLETIVQTALGMARQINDLLDTARLQMRRPLELNLRPVDLAALLRQVVGEQAGVSEAHVIRLEGAERPLPALYDEARLARALTNVLSNAVKYSPQGGEVSVVLSCLETTAESWAIIRVSDQGIGIPPGEIERVFDPYYRASNARSEVEGTGLGLAGVRQIVAAHGGTVELESTEGAGTTVTMRLPHQPIAGDQDAADAAVSGLQPGN